MKAALTPEEHEKIGRLIDGATIEEVLERNTKVATPRGMVDGVKVKLVVVRRGPKLLQLIALHEGNFAGGQQVSEQRNGQFLISSRLGGRLETKPKGKGIGSMLIAEAIDRAISLGAIRVRTGFTENQRLREHLTREFGAEKLPLAEWHAENGFAREKWARFLLRG